MSEQVIELATSVLKPHYRNLEFFDDIEGKDFDNFKKSIADDGVITPVIVSQDMTIVSGHQRYRACVELNIESIPCIIRDDLMDEDDVVRQLIASNLGRIKNNDAKFRKALTEYVKLVGNKRGGDRKSKGQNAPLKKRKEIADEWGISEDELKRQLRISEYLSPEITELFDNNEITKATALLVCKLMPEEQKIIFNTLERHNADDTVNEQLNRAIEELTAKNQKNQKLIERQAKEINELKTREPENVNQSLTKEIAELKVQLEEVAMLKAVSQSDSTSNNDEVISFIVSCTIEDLPGMDDIDTPDDREMLLDDNPDLLLSQIISIEQNKRIVYRVLERALALTDDRNSLLVSWDDYVTLICEYDGSNFQKLVAKIQKYKTNRI